MMDCDEVRPHLIFLLEDDERGEGGGVSSDVREHVAVCADCLRSVRAMQRGHRAVFESVPLLAPARGYLTDQRLGDILSEAARVRGTPRATVRRVRRRLAWYGAAAAVAAGVVIGAFAFRAPAPADDAVRTVAVESASVEGAAAVSPLSFHLHGGAGADAGVSVATVNWPEGAVLSSREWAHSVSELLTIHTGGVSVPTHDTVAAHVRQDDYWW